MNCFLIRIEFYLNLLLVHQKLVFPFTIFEEQVFGKLIPFMHRSLSPSSPEIQGVKILTMT